jgi:hypothetical protein
MVKISLRVINQTVMNMYGRVEVYLHAFLNSVLDAVEWTASRPGRFFRAVGSVGRGADLNAKVKLKMNALDGNRTPLVLPVSQSLY